AAVIENQFLERIRGQDIVLEINAGGLNRPAQEIFPREDMIRRIHQLGFDITVSSDAHCPEHVGFAYLKVHDLLRAQGFNRVCRWTNRKKEYATI
ncbi:MAG: hypothetical protein Q8N36_05065, partial [bacterium]|nr:hypothetical protein [bacterium]